MCRKFPFWKTIYSLCGHLMTNGRVIPFRTQNSTERSLLLMPIETTGVTSIRQSDFSIGSTSLLSPSCSYHAKRPAIANNGMRQDTDWWKENKSRKTTATKANSRRRTKVRVMQAGLTWKNQAMGKILRDYRYHCHRLLVVNETKCWHHFLDVLTSLREIIPAMVHETTAKQTKVNQKQTKVTPTIDQHSQRQMTMHPM